MVLQNEEYDLNKKENTFKFKIKSSKQFYKILMFSILIVIGSVYFHADTNLSLLTQLMTIFLLLNLLMFMANHIIDESNYNIKYPNRIQYIRIIGRILYLGVLIVFYIYFFNSIQY
ncbi:MAG: hypothetical protein HeimC2_05210 [Candidatus Heimdallarchaeota archaeon LC_2]|nr:MAG: hypothetical protein HeimC2_05210 [Candidatus Heimdallarchaeota archaeon LC_2]